MLGGFIAMTEETKTSAKRTVSKILIKLKVQGGLYASIDLVCGSTKDTLKS